MASFGLSFPTAYLHHKLWPQKPDLSRSIIDKLDEILALLRPKPDVGPAPGPTPALPKPQQTELHAYPWISWNKYVYPSESGLAISLTVGSYPEPSGDSVLPSLLRIHEQVGVPVFVNPKEDGWWSCLIYNEDVTWLRAGDEFNKLPQTVSWGPAHNIEVEATIKDDNGRWLIRAVIHEPGDSWEETVAGPISREGKLFPLAVHQANGHQREYSEKNRDPNRKVAFTKAELIALDVPIHESSGTELDFVCKGRPYNYVRTFQKGSKSGTMNHNFGK